MKKRKTKAVAPVKKVSEDFCGVCELRQLPKGTYFRTIDKNGKMSKATYTKGFYDRFDKKFVCDKHSGFIGDSRSLRGTALVTTDFYY